MANIAKRSDGKWRARYYGPDGRQHTKHFARKIDGQRWLTEMHAALQQHRWTDPALARVTVGDWSQRWLAAQVQLKPSTRHRYGSLLKNQVVPFWGNVPLDRVTHADAAAWVAGLTASGLSPSTVRQAHRVLSLVLRLAVRDGRLPRNVAEGVSLPRARRAEQRFLTRDEVERLAACAEEAGDAGDVIRVLALTGLRFGELVALRVANLDPLRRRIRVEESATEVNGVLEWGTPKNHQRRSVPMARSLVEPLARRCEGKAPGDLVFTSPQGEALRLGNWRRRVFDPAVRASGLAHLSPHDLRDTAASLAVAAGANVKAVQRMLGHASAAMTLDVYAGLFDDDLDALADRLDGEAGSGLRDQVGTDASVTVLKSRTAGL